MYSVYFTRVHVCDLRRSATEMTKTEARADAQTSDRSKMKTTRIVQVHRGNDTKG